VSPTLNASYTLEHRYLYGPAVDQVLAQENVTNPANAVSVLWMLTDNEGTVRDLVDNSGSLVQHYKYDAYGNVISGSNTSLTRYLYTGREFDATTGLQYNRERWYDPGTGRWLSQDPAGFGAGDANLYRYVGNSPTNHTDPRGTDWATTGSWWAAIGAEAALVAEEAAAAAMAVVSSPVTLCVAAGAGGFGVGTGINYLAGDPLAKLVNLYYGTAFAAGAYDPAVQAQIDRMIRQIAAQEDKIESIRNCDFGYGPHSIADSEQKLEQMARELADFMAKNPPK
jgi:RHS repeat-associated protein